MRKGLLVAAALAVAALVWPRRASAARERRNMPEIQTDRIDAVAREILRNYGRTLREFPGPIPPGPLVAIIAHESGGRPWATTSASATMTGAEAGLLQAVPEEVSRLNFDPFDPRGAIWGGQSSYAMHANTLGERIKAAHGIAWNEIPVREQVAILMLSRSIGIGATSTIARQSAGRPEATVWARMRGWLASNKADNFRRSWGRQSTEVVRRRLRIVEELLTLGERIIALPDRLTPVPSRPDDLPPAPTRYAERIPELARRARVAGLRSTGPWAA